MSFKRLQSQAGFTLVELMIVVSIIGILIVMSTGWFFQNMRQNQDLTHSQNYSQLKAGVMDASAQAEALSKSEALMFNPNLNGGATPTPYP